MRVRPLLSIEVWRYQKWQLLSWSFPQHRGEMKPLEVGNVPLTQERHSRLI